MWEQPLPLSSCFCVARNKCTCWPFEYRATLRIYRKVFLQARGQKITKHSFLQIPPRGEEKMLGSFSTDLVPVSDRLEAWRWNAKQICGDCRFQFPKRFAFHGSIEARRVADWS